MTELLVVAALVALFVGLTFLDAWHQRRAWRIASAQAAEILRQHAEIDGEIEGVRTDIVRGARMSDHRFKL